MYGNEINSTGSFLSDLSITQSEDDFLDAHISHDWHNHKPSVNNFVPYVGNKRSRLSAAGGTENMPSGGRRSPRRSRTPAFAFDPIPETERIVATTKVTITQDGQDSIRAESTVETAPPQPRQVDALGDIEYIEEASACTLQKSITRQSTVQPITPLIKPKICMNCQKRMRFNMDGLRCRDCPVRCHINCRPHLTICCVPDTPTNKGLMSHLADYAPTGPPMIPALIVHSVPEIESRGLQEKGIYRVSGSERKVKALKKRFLKNKTIPHRGNIDVHVLCGFSRERDFLRSLSEPLIPRTLWETFCNAVQNQPEEDIVRHLTHSISRLPQPSRNTLAFLILHFQRVAESPGVSMPLKNLARAFAPTIFGNSSGDLEQGAILAEIYAQCTIMENLLKIPTEHWIPYVSLETEKENSQNSTNLLRTPNRQNKGLVYSLYATPFKTTLKKRKFFETPPGRKN
uniref:Rho-GAP domain-containing protein n=1 Tax=Glossina austeni TaxID=7395 RepID=A0A1A9V7Y6_GLOAU